LLAGTQTIVAGTLMVQPGSAVSPATSAVYLAFGCGSFTL